MKMSTDPLENVTDATIEYVARSICSTENDDPCGATFDLSDENEKNRYRHMARAAIGALALESKGDKDTAAPTMTDRECQIAIFKGVSEVYKRICGKPLTVSV